MDPSRAPEGAGLLWIQLQELPWHVRGDAAGELETGAGTWTEELRERYADRIQAKIARHVPNLESSIRKRVTLSPADLQAANVNLHQGDPYSGALQLDQNLLWRPLPSSPGHATPVDRLWHIGASTHPGRGSARAPARWLPSGCCDGGRRGGEALGLADHDREPVVRRRPRRLPSGPRGRDRDLGDEARRRLARTLPRERAGRGGGGAGGAVDSAAAADGWPADPGERVEAICAGIRRLAPFEPECVLFLTGPGDDRAAILDGIRAIAQEGREQGVPVALEPIQRVFAEYWTIVSSLDEAAALIGESGADVGLMYDSWHLSREPPEQIARHRDRIRGVHLADWREPTRNTNDRVLPGDGAVDFAPILEALRWDGFYDLEIFSDPELPARSGRTTRASWLRAGSRR